MCVIIIEMSLDRPLSNLEFTALGIVFRKGSCLAHAVVSEIAESQTYAFTSGAGSIYPLLKRLHLAGLLAEVNRKYSITEAGTQVLRNWLKPSTNGEEFSPTLDTIRSQVTFLQLLAPSEQEEFASRTMERLNVLLERCSQTLERHRDAGDRIGELAALGAVRETQARIMWMSEVKHALMTPHFFQQRSESKS